MYKMTRQELISRLEELTQYSYEYLKLLSEAELERMLYHRIKSK